MKATAQRAPVPGLPPAAGVTHLLLALRMTHGTLIKCCVWVIVRGGKLSQLSELGIGAERPTEAKGNVGKEESAR